MRPFECLYASLNLTHLPRSLLDSIIIGLVRENTGAVAPAFQSPQRGEELVVSVRRPLAQNLSGCSGGASFFPLRDHFIGRKELVFRVRRIPCFEILQATFMTLLSECLQTISDPDKVKAFLESVTRCMPATTVCMQTCYVEGIDAFGPKKAFHIGTLEAAVSRLWHA